MPGSVKLGEDNSNVSFLEPWTGPGLDAAVWDNYVMGTGAGSISVSSDRGILQRQSGLLGIRDMVYLVTKNPSITLGGEVSLTTAIELDVAAIVSNSIRGSVYISTEHIATDWFQNRTDWIRLDCFLDSTGETWSLTKRVSGVETDLFSTTGLDIVAATIKLAFDGSQVQVWLNDLQIFSGPHDQTLSTKFIYAKFLTTENVSSHESRFGEVRVYDPQFVTTGTLTGSMDLGSTPDDPGVLSWNASMPSGAGLNFRTRTSDTGTGNWSSWSGWLTDSKGSNITSPSRRHLEYQASFSTTLIQYSPVLHDVTAQYASGAGLSAESVYNYPNPFSPLEGPTTLRFDLETPAPVDIQIYDLLGRPKWSLSLAQGAVLPGVNEIPWMGVDNRGNALPNGAYLMTVEASGIKVTKKIAILR